MKARIQKMAMIEGSPWYFYPERPHQTDTPPAIKGVKHICHWSEATTAPYFLTDFMQNGYIVLTENGEPLEADGWVCERANLPADWTYEDHGWKLTLLWQWGNEATFMAATL